jgi:hypothetical protein
MNEPKRRAGKRALRSRDLHGVDLHGADLRGVDLTASNLRGADLSGAVTGRPVAWTVALGAAGVVLSWLLGVVAGRIAADVRVWLTAADARYRVAAYFVIAQVVLFLIVVLWRGMAVALSRVTAIAAAVTLAIALVMVVTGLGSGRAALAALWLVLVAGALVSLGVLARISAGSAVPWLFYVSAVGGGLMGREAGGGILVVAMAIVAALVGRRALGKKRYDPLESRWVDAVACVGGTRFRGADLTGAKLSGATLRNSDFRDAAFDESQLKDVRKVEGCVFKVPAESERRASPRHER